MVGSKDAPVRGDPRPREVAHTVRAHREVAGRPGRPALLVRRELRLLESARKAAMDALAVLHAEEHEEEGEEEEEEVELRAREAEAHGEEEARVIVVRQMAARDAATLARRRKSSCLRTSLPCLNGGLAAGARKKSRGG